MARARNGTPRKKPNPMVHGLKPMRRKVLVHSSPRMVQMEEIRISLGIWKGGGVEVVFSGGVGFGGVGLGFSSFVGGGCGLGCSGFCGGVGLV